MRSILIYFALFVSATYSVPICYNEDASAEIASRDNLLRRQLVPVLNGVWSDLNSFTGSEEPEVLWTGWESSSTIGNSYL
ncbi:unnamed protein product [Rhizopus stolonifer]